MRPMDGLKLQPAVADSPWGISCGTSCATKCLMLEYYGSQLAVQYWLVLLLHRHSAPLLNRKKCIYFHRSKGAARVLLQTIHLRNGEDIEKHTAVLKQYQLAHKTAGLTITKKRIWQTRFATVSWNEILKTGKIELFKTSTKIVGW